MTNKEELHQQIYFSYHQFMVYDNGIRNPVCDLTKTHFEQGFARRESTVTYRTLVQFGTANLTVVRGPFVARQEYARAISVPFFVSSGKVLIEGPEANRMGFFVTVPPGHYRLTAAQWLVEGEELLEWEEEEQAIDLFFEPLAEPLRTSAILIADAELNPPTPLIETADIAGGY